MKAKLVNTPYGPCLKLRYRGREISVSAEGETSVYQEWLKPDDTQAIARFETRGPRAIREAQFFIKLFNKGLLGGNN